MTKADERVKAGDKINTFTVLNLAAHGRLGKHKRWNIRCECGVELEKYSTDIKRQTSCGCLNKLDPIKAMYAQLIRRNSRFSGKIITIEKFTELSVSHCHYCNSAPSNSAYGWSYTGIDRIDSSLGYVTGNVRPCCWVCNRMKSDMNENEFFDHIAKISQIRAAFEAGKPFI